jgi:hypothetical protein
VGILWKEANLFAGREKPFAVQLSKLASVIGIGDPFGGIESHRIL